MILKTFCAAAVAALMASAASAVVIPFYFDAGGSIQSLPVSASGSGSFTTAADTGIFSLGLGLTDFAANGHLQYYVDGEDFSLGLTDLGSFSATLVNGTVQSLSFATTTTVRNFTLNNAGLAPGNFSLQSRAGAIGGDLVIGDRPAGAVPEPATWALMLIGFGAIGAAMRSRRKVAVSFG